MQKQTLQPWMHHQLAAIGLSPNDIRTRLNSGNLRRIRRGAYSEGVDDLSDVESHLELLLASLPGTEPSNVVSHASAAVLHGLPVPTSHLVHVWMTRRSAGHGDGGTHLIVRASPLDPSDVTQLDGISVTTLARTAADMARTAPRDWGVVICDAALRSGLSRQDLVTALERHPRLRGIVRARSIVKFADAMSESPAESMSRANMAYAGVSAPHLQFEIYDGNGELVARTDFAWPELRLVGEVDGEIKYGKLLKRGQTASSVIMSEKRREEAIRQQGFWVVRWDWEIASDPRRLGPLLRNVMASQTRRLAG